MNRARVAAIPESLPMNRRLPAWFVAALLSPALTAASRGEPPTPDKGNPARTDLYGDPLPDGALARLGTTRWRPGTWVHVLVYSPDGSVLASDGYDRTIRLWEAATGRLIRTLWGHQEPVSTLAFSPDGKLLASGGGDKTLRLWDIATGKELRRLTGHQGAVHLAAFGPGGKTLVSASSEDGTVRRWDPDTGKEQGQFRLPSARHRASAFSPNGRWLLVTGPSPSPVGRRDHQLLIMETDTGRELRSIGVEYGDGSVAAFSADGKILVTADPLQNKVHVWDPATGQLRNAMDVVRPGTYCLALSPDAKTLALEEDQEDRRRITLREVATGKELHALPGQRNVWAMTFAPNGKSLLAASPRAMLGRWDVQTGKLLAPGGHQNLVWSLAFSPDGRMLISGNCGRDIRLWDCATSKQVHEFEAPDDGRGVRVAFSADGTTVAAGEDIIRVWNVASRKLLHQFSVLPQRGNIGVSALVLSADGKTLFVGTFNHGIRRWDLALGKELPPLLGNERCMSCPGSSPDGKTIVSVGRDNTVSLWDAATCKELHCLRGHAGRVTSAAISPDGKTVASWSLDRTIRLWDAATGKEIRSWRTYHDYVCSMAFSPDGSHLASAGVSQVIGLWEVATGRALPPLVGHHGPVYRVAFSPDGKALASAGEDTTILLWDVDRLLRQKRLPTPAFAAEELELYWHDLADRRAHIVRAAKEVLCAAGPWTTNRIRQRLPEALAGAGRVGRLLGELDSDDFDTREKASAELAKLVTLAEPALRMALEKQPSAEVRRRVAILLEKLPKPETKGSMDERLCPLVTLALLEWIDSPEARQLLKEVAEGPPESDATKEAQAILERVAKRPR
jgi:WD40 repeat protein